MSLPQLLPLIIISCFFFNCCSSTDTISSSRPIKDPQTITSSNGTFIFGFFNPPNSTNRYVGVIYNIPVHSMTPIWVANRDNPMNDSLGTVTISDDGNLVVIDGQQAVVWSSNLTNSMTETSVRILDSSNLVLFDNSSNSIWESFQYPSDAYMAGMAIGTDTKSGRNKTLVSWRTPSDPFSGRFTLMIRPLNVPEFFILDGSRPHWRSGPWNGQVFTGIGVTNPIFRSGFTFVDDKNGNASLTFTYAPRGVQLFYKLGFDGVLQEVRWYEGLKNWEISWSNEEDDCDIYGKCGNFGVCNSKKSPICRCLTGFEPVNYNEWSRGVWRGGCSRRKQLKCQRNLTDMNEKEDGFLKFSSVKLPDFSYFIEAVEDDCVRLCLNSCGCIAYAYSIGIGCMHWNRSLIDIKKLTRNYGADLNVRAAYSELGKKNGKKLVIIPIAVILGSICGALFLFFAWIYCSRTRGRKQKLEQLLSRRQGVVSPEVQGARTDMMLEDMHIFEFHKLTAATDYFHTMNKLGEGGFGPVYKGKLQDGREIAVKRLSRLSGQGLEEFKNEVIMISKLQHRNLVRLLGCCIAKEEKILIYEYMPNGSLDSILFGSDEQRYLNWSTRVNIIEGIARGLLYLHRDSRLRIIHRDLKASNILLDHKLNPKISDFGMARILGGDEDQAKTLRVVGTYGYMAPEYAMRGRFSEKSDVYSFGMVVLEIISGRRNSSFYDADNFSSLLRCVWKLWNDGNIIQLVDQKIWDPRIEPEIVKHIHVGLLCVQEFADDRPTVSAVLSMLSSENTDLPTPNLPAFSERQEGTSSGEKLSLNNLSLTVVEGR